MRLPAAGQGVGDAAGFGLRVVAPSGADVGVAEHQLHDIERHRIPEVVDGV